MKNIRTIYASNFFLGFVFFYGIEKLYFQSIGITASQIGILTALLIGGIFALDIPMGILADKWSRKIVALIAFLALLCHIVIAGTAQNMWQLIFSYLAYIIYVAASSGTMQSLMYDTLKDVGQESTYSKQQGRAHATFMVSVGIGNIIGGLIGSRWGFRPTYLLSLIGPAIGALIVLSLREPSSHKHSKSMFRKDLSGALKILGKNTVITTLVLFSMLIASSEVFRSEFGQLYLSRYTPSIWLIGALWALYAFTWGIGSFIAHRLHNIELLSVATVLSLILFASIDKNMTLIIFYIHCVLFAALANRIETKIQDASPTHTRTSILSIFSSVNRLVSVPASLYIGYLISSRGILIALRFTVVLAAVGYILYFVLSMFKGKSLQETNS